MTKTTIGIVGIGHLGSRHLKVYSELAEKADIIGVCDRKQERTQKLADHYKVKFFDNYKDLLGKVDAVSICVPTVNHFEITKDFLQSDTHVLVEKPMTITLKEADKLITLAQKKNLKLQVGHVERFNSAFEAVKPIAQDPLFIECHRLNQFPNRSLDIGVVMDLMIHDIDIILGLVRSKIKDIQAVGVKVLTSMEDIANARITFTNGCVCNLTASRVSDDVTRKIRIFLKDTYISLDYMAQQASVYKKSGPLISKTQLPIEKEEPLKKEIESFIDCVRENKTPVVSGIEGREALKVALAICQKIWTPKKNT